ncbi:MAG: serine/threonine protein kinase [Polyangiaceae bacterium]|nr:serine/threonine protein kinase [Polyangiaceae bacterium]
MVFAVQEQFAHWDTVPGKPAMGAPVHVIPGAGMPGAGAPHAPAGHVGATAARAGSGPLPFGFLVDSKYSIDSVLGEGGMGIVYLATDIHTNMPVVVKAIRAEYAHKEEFRNRILDEGRVLARIDHQNVVRLNAVVVEPRDLFLVMQFVDGESLEKTIDRYVLEAVHMPIDLVHAIFEQVLDGVGAAHEEGVIHRDIKPANILIRSRDAKVKVTDFGIAKADEVVRAARGATKGIIGSLLYMSPEQIRGQKDLDYRSDIYSLGILLYELLTGKVPFDGESDYETMSMHLHQQMPSVLIQRPDIPPHIDAVIQRACAKNRDDRFSSTSEMKAAFRAETARGSIAGIDGPGRFSIASHYAQPVVAPPKKKSRIVRTLLYLGFVLLGAGIVLAFVISGYLPWGPQQVNSGRSRPGSSASHRRPDRPRPSASVPTPPANPLVGLVGVWKSDSGRMYDAVMRGDVLEFQIKDVSGAMRNDGYENGDVRFDLQYMANEVPSVITVRDIVRLSPPDGSSYNRETSRGSCQTIRRDVNGQRLLARVSDREISVDVAKIAPEARMFVKNGRTVVRCQNLDSAKATKILSKLIRVE